MKHILSLISLSLLLFGCEKYASYYVNSYVEDYVDPEYLVLDTLSYGNYFKLAISAQNARQYCNIVKNKDIYNYYCSIHHDDSYHHKILYPTRMNAYSRYDYSAVNVTSTIDWDSAHPAGMSLNDIVHFISVSPYKYILSGCKTLCSIPTETTSEYCKDAFSSSSSNVEHYFANRPQYPIDKKCSELTADDLVLLGWGVSLYRFAYLVFETPPPKPCTVNVKLTATTGKEFGASIDVE